MQRTSRVLILTLVALGLVAGPVAAADQGDAPPAAAREELGEAQPLNAPGQTMYLQRVTIPPGAKLPDHFHRGTQVARVVRGVLTYDVLSGTVQITRRDGSTESVKGPETVKIRAGESLVEVESLVHAGSNAGKRAVVIELAALLATGAPLATTVGSGTEGTPLAITADLTSQATTLTTVGAGGAVTYGWNRLTGTAAGATGTGTFTGSRDAALGQPVKATFTMTVLPAK